MKKRAVSGTGLSPENDNYYNIVLRVFTIVKVVVYQK